MINNGEPCWVRTSDLLIKSPLESVIFQRIFRHIPRLFTNAYPPLSKVCRNGGARTGLNLNIRVTYEKGRFNTYRLPHYPLPKAPRPFIQDLIIEAEKLWNVAPGTIKSRNRHTWAIDPRHAVVYAARRMTKHSYPAIGRAVGGFDHSTMIHAGRRAAHRRMVDPDFRELSTQLMWNVRNKRRGL